MLRIITQSIIKGRSSLCNQDTNIRRILKSSLSTSSSHHYELNQENKYARKRLKVLVTGAAGQIGYSLAPLLASGYTFGRNTLVKLVLNDIPECENILKGIKMELEDCAYSNYDGCEVICDPEQAYKNVDCVVMLANMMQLTPETSRFELLKENKRVYSELAKIIDSTAKPTTKFLMVANPANTNCLLLMESVKSIPTKNFTCLTYLDYNRTRSIVARTLKMNPRRLRHVIVWGNHSSTMFPDLTHAEYSTRDRTWEKVTDVIKDEKWLYEELPKFVQTRFTAIIEARKKSSSLSAANAASNHLRSWYIPHNTQDWCCLGVKSIGQYGLPDNIVFGTPCYAGNEDYQIIENLKISPLIREKMQISAEELLKERDSIMG